MNKFSLLSTTIPLGPFSDLLETPPLFAVPEVKSDCPIAMFADALSAVGILMKNPAAS